MLPSTVEREEEEWYEHAKFQYLFIWEHCKLSSSRDQEASAWLIDLNWKVFPTFSLYLRV